MAKWYGNIGFAFTVEEPKNSGIWVERIINRPYSGDVIKNVIRRSPTDRTINDNIGISNSISIIYDAYAKRYVPNIAYVEYLGARWKVNDISIEHPRITLSIGGLYNGEETGSPCRIN